MKVVGFSGYSGSGKTTLIEKLIGCLKQAGQRVSVIKHAHHRFDIDHPGKDSYRHREAGAFEVVVASNRRLAKVREYEVETEISVHQLLAELAPCDWAIVEGFRHADLTKIEVWRAETGERAHYPDDPFVIAVATDAPHNLPVPTGLPVFHLDDVQAVAEFLLSHADRHEYTSPFDADA
ncbi:molybdopterin-guanine dinucleotide biosynthesis protein B [Piscinibacter gummiphilus]|uniref:Molybdopterin-guanine dinucleotide biosynthesis protein B n=1 Tax=Piscinibacter gummiphilus TaxID=946333 RepID=A0ABZ0CP59_9BURK|nr:molybdopterin-guanine dinucleotide biosynthesis protein B [Piscinibacter gummiphilus]WOB06306.1 molybdopterin-guanine dinucleotide biosynthesis protein B [Piscinibacter gummiphilus]